MSPALLGRDLDDVRRSRDEIEARVEALFDEPLASEAADARG